MSILERLTGNENPYPVPVATSAILALGAGCGIPGLKVELQQVLPQEELQVDSFHGEPGQR